MPTQRINTNRISDNAIRTAKIANNNVTADDLQSGLLIPAGTLMLFVQTAAPTGWTKSTTHNDKALRVVSGAANFGGNTAFSVTFANRTPAGTVGNTTLTAAQSGLPQHSHGVTDPTHTHTQSTSSTDGASGRADASSGGTLYTGVSNIDASATGISIQNAGPSAAAESHTHTWTGTVIDFGVQYVDVIIASKD